MTSISPVRGRARVLRLIVITLLSIACAFALLHLGVSARRGINPSSPTNLSLSNTSNADQQPNAPSAAVIVATLTDNVTAATKVVPGGTINYTATITNNGAASPADDAINLNFSAPLDANTTLVPGSVHASPIAFNDTYNWVGNTFLDSSARGLAAVTVNDVAVNAPGGTDTFTVTAIAGGATSLGGTVTLASPSGTFTYTPPLNRPNAADGAAVNDTFTYTITNSADPSLTSTGTVTITLTGRVFYLQAGAAGDGRSNTPSGNPATMSTNANKSTDIFYIFSNAGSLNGLFTVDAGQQLLGQGVNLVVNIPVLGSTTLFNSAAPTPTTTNTGAGNCVTLAGAPGNNTLSGFNIGNCTALAIQGANVGTLAISTLSINTTGGGLDLTGVATPTVNIVLGGLTATGGTVGANLVGLNGTINLAGGTLSGGSGAEFTVSGGAATVTYTGAITQNNAQRVVNVQGTTGGSVTLSGTITGGASSLGVHIGDTSTANGNVSFTTLNLGTIGARMTNQAVTITNGGSTTAYSLGAVGIFTSGATAQGIAATNLDGTLNLTSGTVDAAGARAINIDGPAGKTTLGMTLTKVSANGGANGISIQDTDGSFTVAGSGGNCTEADQTCTGGLIQNTTGADVDPIATHPSGAGVALRNASNISLTRIRIASNSNYGIHGATVSGFTLSNSVVNGVNGTNVSSPFRDSGIRFDQLTGTALITTSLLTGGFQHNLLIDNQSGTANITITGNTIKNTNAATGDDGFQLEAETTAVVNAFVTNNSFSAHGGDHFGLSLINNADVDLTFTGNTFAGGHAIGLGQGLFILGAAFNGTFNYDISNNGTAIAPLTGNKQGGMIHVNKGSGTGTFSGRIQNNFIGNAAIVKSGSEQAFGIYASARGTGGSHTTLINSNTVRQYFDTGIVMEVGEGAAAFNATATNNTVSNFADAVNSLHGIYSSNGILASDTNAVCVDMRTNSVATAGNEPQGGADIRLRKSPTAPMSVRIPGLVGSTATDADNKITADNPTATTVTVTGSGFTGGAACTQPTLPAAPAEPEPIDDKDISVGNSFQLNGMREQEALIHQPSVMLPQPVMQSASSSADKSSSVNRIIKRAVSSLAYFAARVDALITPTAYAQDSGDPDAPSAGENVTLNAIGTLPAAGKSITIRYSATVNTTVLTARQASTQGTVTANGPISVQTDDPDVGGTQATITLLDATLTWTGDTSTDWNVAANWDRPGPVESSYAPGVSNPAVNDVVIPNVGAQPAIAASDINIFSLNLANGRTLTIEADNSLTINGSAAGSDLTLNGIISGGTLFFAGAGPHVINNAGGTGSLSASNIMAVQSPAVVTLNNNLQAGAVSINAGATFNITNRMLSLNGSGAALTASGTFTITGSTVQFNGSAAQTTGTVYNNLTINNPAGVTLTSSSTVNGTLALTNGDLNTSTFTLTQPNTTASTGTGDVVGTVIRTGGPFPLGSLTFGNPNNIITFTGAGTRPTTMTAVMAKAAPATYAAAVQRNYTISQTGGTGFTATVRLHYLDSELNGNTPETSLGLRRLRTSDSHWVAAPPPPGVPTRDGTANWVEATGVLAADLTTQWTFSTLVPTAANGSITGRIVDNNGNAVEGAVVRLEGAQNRKFITDADGFYRFDQVETGGFYTVTPSRVNYTFSPASRSFSQTGSSTDAVFSATLATSENFMNPLDTPEYFVRQHYLDFLGREPDEAGFNFWSDQIIECGFDQGCIERRRENVSAAYFLSIEFQKTGGLVDGLYRASYGVRPAFADFMPDTRMVGNGIRVGDDGWEAKLEANKEAFVAAFVNRPAFQAAFAGLSNADYVDTLISHTGVGFTISERDAFVSGLGTGTMNRADVLRSIAEDNRFVAAKFNETFVMMEYFGYLRRDADSQGFTFWLTKLNEFNGNFEQAEMVKAFIVAGEYRDRFPR